MIGIYITIGFFVGLSLIGIRIVSQWEKGLVFRFGKVIRTIDAGLNWIIPFIDSVIYVDTRIRTIDVVPQEIMTKDSVPVRIDAVVYYKIFDVKKSIIEVENFRSASTLMAQSKLRDVVSKYDLDTLLSQKDTIGNEVLKVLQIPTDVWGVNVTSVEIKNMEIPDNMKRAMAKESEAMREKRARIIKASAEFEASQKFSEAAKLMTREALVLRQLQTWQEIGAEQNSTIILVPTDLISGLTNLSKVIKK